MKVKLLSRVRLLVTPGTATYQAPSSMTRWTFVGKVMSLLFNMLSRLVIVFLPRSKCLLISWLQSWSAVILEPKKIKSDTVSIVSPSVCHEVMGPDAMILVFWMLSFKPAFSLSSFTFIKRLFSSSLSARRVVSSAYLRLLKKKAATSLQTALWNEAFQVSLRWFSSSREAQAGTRDAGHSRHRRPGLPAPQLWPFCRLPRRPVTSNLRPTSSRPG